MIIVAARRDGVALSGRAKTCCAFKSKGLIHRIGCEAEVKVRRANTSTCVPSAISILSCRKSRPASEVPF